MASLSLADGASRTQSSEYNTWKGMRARCLNASHDAYHLYGGRGIGICQRWADDFDAFVADMGFRPDGMTLDRIDNDGNYEPGNCRWATRKQQSRNRNDNRLVSTPNGDVPLTQAAELAGLTPEALAWRLANDWPVEKVFHGMRRDRRRAGREDCLNAETSTVVRDGKLVTIEDEARSAGLTVKTVHLRIRRGWPQERWFLPLQRPGPKKGTPRPPR